MCALLSKQNIGHPAESGIWSKLPGGSSGSMFSLAAIRSDVLRHCECLRDSEAPFGSFRTSPQGRCDLYSSCDVALIMAVMGEPPLATLAPAECAEWTGHINSFASSAGRIFWNPSGTLETWPENTTATIAPRFFHFTRMTY